MGSAARFVPRSPRYVFRPQDEKLLRFAGMETKGKATKATVRDLSTTGISFVTGAEHAPKEGEMLKVEFGLPATRANPSQVAWFANVVRVEKRSEWDPQLGELPYTVIALSFHQVPANLVTAISRSLRLRVAGSEGGRADVHEPETFDTDRLDAKRAIFFLVFTGILVLCFLAMAMPSHLWPTLLKAR